MFITTTFQEVKIYGNQNIFSIFFKVISREPHLSIRTLNIKVLKKYE